MITEHKFMLLGAAMGCVVGGGGAIIYGAHTASEPVSLADITCVMVHNGGIGCAVGGFVLALAGLLLEDRLSETHVKLDLFGHIIPF